MKVEEVMEFENMHARDRLRSRIWSLTKFMEERLFELHVSDHVIQLEIEGIRDAIDDHFSYSDDAHRRIGAFKERFKDG